MVEAHPDQLAERAADGLLDVLRDLARPWLVRVFRLAFGATDEGDERAAASDLKAAGWARRLFASQPERRARVHRSATGTAKQRQASTGRCVSVP